MTTTEAKHSGFAQSKTHQVGEDELKKDDRMFVLRQLNEKLNPMLSAMGFDTEGGEWGYVEADNISLADRLDIDLKLNEVIDIDEDYFYDRYKIPRPTGELAGQKGTPEPAPNDTAQAKKKRAAKDKRELMHLYSHAKGCGCETCKGIVNLADGNYNPRFKKLPDALTDDYVDKIYNLKIKSGDVHEGLFKEVYGRLKDATEHGFGKKFTDFDNLEEFEVFQKSGVNLSRFAAHRMESLNKQLIAELYDANGKKLPKADFDKKAKTINKRYNRYLKTEVQAARRRASMAEKWATFKKRASIYPNVRYVTKKDDLVRDTHKVLHGIIRPIDDEFWNTHTPPLAWNCRCNLEQTDAAPTEIPEGSNAAVIQKGFETDPVSGDIFGEKHPYFYECDRPLSIGAIRKSGEDATG